MLAIYNILDNVVQTITPYLPAATNEIIAAAPQAIDQTLSVIRGSVIALAVIGGGIALMKQYRTPAENTSLDDLQNHQAVLEYIQQGRLTLQQVPHFCNDFEIVRAAVEQDPYAIQYVGQELRDERPIFREIASTAITTYGAIKNTANFCTKVLQLIKLFRMGSIAQYMPELHNDLGIIQQLAQQHQSNLQYAGMELYEDPNFRELMIGIIRGNPFALEYAGSFQNDYEIVGLATAAVPDMLKYASSELRQRPEFVNLEIIAQQRTAPLVLVDDVYILQSPISYQEAVTLLYQNPNSTLEEELTNWLNEYKKDFPLHKAAEPKHIRHGELLSLKHEEKDILRRYLQRIREVKDYQNGGLSKKNIVRRVYFMLDLASRNERFKKNIIQKMEVGLRNCSDNVMLTLNDIEVASQFYEKSLSEEEFRDLAIGAERYHRLQKYVEENLAGKEEVETLLYLQIHLKEDLRLPITTTAMAHPGMSGVSPKILKKARKAILSISEEELLASSTYWEEHVAHSKPDKLSEINTYYGALVNDLNDYFSEKEADRKAFLEKNPSARNFLAYAEQQGVAKDRYSILEFVGTERGNALAKQR